MRANWKECPRDDVMPQYAGIYVTMNPMGNIVLSRVTFQMMDEPKAVVILFDEVNQRIGLRPASPYATNAYPLRRSNRSGAKLVRGHRLTREFRIDLPHTVRFYDADINGDGVLILDLRTARLCPRAAAHARRRNPDALPNGR